MKLACRMRPPVSAASPLHIPKASRWLWPTSMSTSPPQYGGSRMATTRKRSTDCGQWRRCIRLWRRQERMALGSMRGRRCCGCKPGKHLPVGWCSDWGLAALYGCQTHSSEIHDATYTKTPARHDGQVLAQQLRLVLGLKPAAAASRAQRSSLSATLPRAVCVRMTACLSSAQSTRE